MKREKILIFLLAMSLILSLTACGAEEEAKEPVRAAVFCATGAGEDTALYGALDTALNGSGLVFRKHDASTRQDQLEQIDTAIGEGFGLLIVDPVEEDAAAEILEKARAAGIGVIFMGCQADFGDYELACCVCCDGEDPQTAQGRMIGGYLLEHFEEADLNGDGVITYLLLGESAGAVRKAEQVLADGGLATLRAYEPAGEDPLAETLENCRAEDHNMVECIIAGSDDLAMEAVEALQAAGYNGEGQIRVCVFGRGGNADARNAVAAGTLTGTVYADPAGAAEAICGAALKLAAGEAPGAQYVTVPYQTVTAGE